MFASLLSMSFYIYHIFTDDDWSYIDLSNDEYDCKKKSQSVTKDAVFGEDVQGAQFADLYDGASTCVTNKDKSNDSKAATGK